MQLKYAVLGRNYFSKIRSPNSLVKAFSNLLTWAVAVWIAIPREALTSPSILISLYSLICVLSIFALVVEFRQTKETSRVYDEA